MPTYDFECDCSFKTTEIDSISGDKIKYCPSCGNRTLIRLIGSGSGFTFNSGYKDKSGDRIHFKEPYFDTAFRRSFKTAREKAEFMNSNGIVSAGDSDTKVKREKKEHYEQKNDTKKEKRNGN